MKRLVIGSLLFALTPGISLAEFGYTNFEVSLIDVEVDSGFANVDGDGFSIAGAYELTDKVFLLGEWQDQSYDFGIDGTTMEIGAGLNHALSPDLDLVGTLSYIDTELEVQGFTASDDGLALGGGIRSKLGESFELDAMLQWVDYDEAGSDTAVGVTARYYFKQTMALFFGLDMADETDGMRIGFRAEF
jgi:porin-like protein